MTVSHLMDILKTLSPKSEVKILHDGDYLVSSEEIKTVFEEKTSTEDNEYVYILTK